MMRGALFLFSALNETDIGWMAHAGSIRRFAAGDALIRTGETIDQLLVLLDGVVRVETAEGRVIALRREGECLGEVSLVDTLPTSSSVIASSAGKRRRWTSSAAATWSAVGKLSFDDWPILT